MNNFIKSALHIGSECNFYCNGDEGIHSVVIYHPSKHTGFYDADSVLAHLREEVQALPVECVALRIAEDVVEDSTPFVSPSGRGLSASIDTEFTHWLCFFRDLREAPLDDTATMT